TLLTAIVDDPERPSGEIDILDDDERHRLLYEWNATDAPVALQRIDELISSQALVAPQRIAVEAGDRHLTYAELELRSNRLAHHLQRVGAGSGGLVGLCVTRTTDLIVALLGILKSGAGYVPLDPAYPTERLAFMLRD